MNNNWKKDFYKPSVYWLEFTANKDFALVSSNHDDEYQLYVYDCNKNTAIQITNEKGGKLFGSISPSGKYVYYLKDTDGSEVGHVYRVSCFDLSEECVSEDIEEFSAFFIRSSANDFICAWTASRQDLHYVYYVQFNESNTEKPVHCALETANYVEYTIVSRDGSFLCFNEIESNEDRVNFYLRIYDVNNKNLFTVDTSGYNSVIPSSFLGTHNNLLLAVCSKNDRNSPIIINIESGEIRELTTNLEGDITPLDYNDLLESLLICNEYNAKQELAIFNMTTNEVQKLPGIDGAIVSWYGSAALHDDLSVTALWESAKHTPCIATLKGEGNFTPIYPLLTKSQEDNNVPEWQSVHFKSESGHQIQGWLLMPKHHETSIPFIISAHGGPHAVSHSNFSAEALMWVKNGYGYLAVNYSGSTSFGEKFRISIRGKPGMLEAMDMVAARAYVIRQCNADETNIVIMGWSWGGYITLLTVGLYPKLWSAGIAGIPVADTIASYEDESASFKSLDHELFGGSPAQVPEIYHKSSPITYVNNVLSPVLIIHAKNDSRCPARQVENYIAAMNRADKTIEVHWFESGHLGHFSNPEVATNNFDVALQFLKKYT